VDPAFNFACPVKYIGDMERSEFNWGALSYMLAPLEPAFSFACPACP